ncbi:hypothetical protein AMATHDRAFT_67134 [Amanita thiersii Skay4041]|uniref:PH domain-containing protein n=1 Tax=Amanita thiersii Skay4041 TaxID=703135 RepID=A0A2A9NHD7_9AGAR|nr:hypothetical protein AMATHDRAFT_67134 [Amanita thiersii Skay4041]
MSETTSNKSSNNNRDAVSSTNATEQIYQVKLLQALRSGDPALIHPFLAEIGKDRRSSAEGDVLDTSAAALHLAIRCGSPNTVSLFLSHRAISPNGVHPLGSGTTPLHLAASLGRVEIVTLLLEQESIDDTLRDGQGRTCKDVAKTKEVIRAIDDSRSFLNASYRSLLHSYILSPPAAPPPPSLLSLLESPRIRFVDLSYLDDDSGGSLLHEAARRKDLRLIELAVRAGADVFVRNRRGKTAYEGAGKDDQVRVFLRQYANHDNTLIHSPQTELPTLKGYLNKYTNVAKGYNTRWFVLKGGVLSYYRHQEDETVASRGSISMKNALLKTAGDRLRFEVHSVPMRQNTMTHTHSSLHVAGSGGGSGGSIQKWYLKANHPVEAARWAQAVERSINYYKRERDNGGLATGRSDRSVSSGGGEGDTARRKSGESDISYMKGGAATSLALSLSTSAGTSLLKKSAKLGAGGNGAPFHVSPTKFNTGNGVGRDSPTLSVHLFDQPSGAEDGGPNLLDGEDDDGEEEGETSSADSLAGAGGREPPYEDGFELHRNATVTQLELVAQLYASLSSSQSQSSELDKTFKDALSMLQEMVGDYVQMVNMREGWWRKRLDREMDRQKVWEESLALVVKEGEDLEKELKRKSRRRGSRLFDSELGIGVIGDVRAGRSKSRVASSTLSPSTVAAALPKEVKDRRASTGHLPMSPPSLVLPPLVHDQGMIAFNIDKKVVTAEGLGRQATVDTIKALPSVLEPEEMEELGTDEEDEFFDAIEMNNLPNLVVHESFSPLRAEMMPVAPLLPMLVADLGPYVGYEKLRDRLKLKADNRPSTSLWSVLKHSIGKDLTRISFPVFFNEPTSMLQRMAEDMEFSECLDAAAKEDDPLRRIAFVAAFAMSNYSSTIGRIAKPFNPMLSETFEYVRLDKQYRYVSEQVSHHPPISACYAESPLWHYFGEVDAQNKFMGKSFEIRPTGVAHAELILPESLGPRYPKAPAKYGPGKVVEHYTWKKVTTNISGFILGSPTIDHYGDMVVTNHRTGDQCVLTFKPRGWRGKDAYEITGQVVDANGDVAYEIAGRWNSQLVARAVEDGSGGRGMLHPDTTVNSPNASHKSEFILLWRNSEKPSGMPFNLTPFSMTLNDCPRTTLRPYLAPTDCRLRPDQRAFEVGKYELANGLKQAQEERQRAVRKAREEGKMPPHRPRWFVAETDGDTGDRVWTPVRVGAEKAGELEYWVERERVFRSGGKAEWKDVERIFIDEPEEIREL